MDRLSASIIVALLIVIAVLSRFLLSRQTQITAHPAPSVVSTTTPPPSAPRVNAPLSSRVRVTFPKKGATVDRTFTVTGEAPGSWYSEASFPVMVQDKDGNKIGQIAALAQGEWMTNAQVPFVANLIISGTYSGPATLVLLKDNPSGMPENDDSVSFPITIR